MGLSRADILPIGIVAALAGAALGWNAFVGLSWTPSLIVILPILVMLLAASAYYRVFRPVETKLAEISLYAALWIFFPIFGTRLTYLALTLDIAPRDQLFSTADLMLSFRWADWHSFVFAHPWILWSQTVAYQSSLFQPFVIVPLLAFFAPPKRNAELLTAILVALVITIVVASCTPAYGPAHDAGMWSSLDDLLNAIKSRSPKPLPYNGIIWLPSFHTVMGLLFTWSQRGIRWSFPIFAAINMTMISATLAIGDHYLVDVLGGIAVAIFAQMAHSLYQRAGVCDRAINRRWTRVPMSRAIIPTIISVFAGLTSVYEWAVFCSTFSHPGTIGLNYNAVGTDWMVFHGSARAYLAGHFSITFDGDRFTEYLNSTYHNFLSSPLPFRPWVNPPSLLVLLIPFGALPFFVSLGAFQIASAGALFFATATGDNSIPRSWAAMALVAPAAAVCVVSGQLSFFCAALLIGGMSILPRNPVIAGLLFALLTVKPQFFVFIPVALIAARQWRALSATFFFATLLAGFSVLLVGTDAWTIWLGQTFAGVSGSGSKWVEYGRLWGTSVFASAAALGVPLAVASIIQTVFSVGAALAVFVLYRSAVPPRTKLAFFLSLTILGAPHSSPSDCLLLVLAVFYWLSDAPPGKDNLSAWAVPLLVWILPLFLPAVLTKWGGLLPLIILILLAQFAGSLRRTATDPPIWHSRS